LVRKADDSASDPRWNRHLTQCAETCPAARRSAVFTGEAVGIAYMGRRGHFADFS